MVGQGFSPDTESADFSPFWRSLGAQSPPRDRKKGTIGSLNAGAEAPAYLSHEPNAIPLAPSPGQTHLNRYMQE